LELIEKPISDFWKHYPNHPKPVTCSESDKVVDAMTKMSKSGVYRIYCVDENQKPIRVITLTDIVDLLLKLAA